MTKEELKKAYNETEKLLDKQIEATYKVVEENAELKEQIEALANVNIKAQNIIGEAKEIIKLLLGDLRNRSYEPVKDLERAEQFLNEVEK